MKKLFGIIAIALLFSFAGMQSVEAQVSYSVTFGWNDVACSCEDPLDQQVKITLYPYPTGDAVDEPGWKTPTSNPYTYNSTVDELDDCETDCYKVVVEIKYTDSSGLCCSGSGWETFTGEELENGATFTLTIPLN